MDIKQLITVRSISDRAGDVARAEHLAGTLGLSHRPAGADASRFFLAFHEDRLQLHDNSPSASARPLCVDFLAGPSYYRFLRDLRIGQPLARAVGIKKGVRPTVCDVTAGFGEDGFVLACLGCRVDLVERSPVIWALLENGLQRAAAHPRIGPLIADRVNLHLAEATGFLASAGRTFDTIYLDPMYPATGKAALNKQKMRMLRAIVGDDPDSPALLAAAKRYGPSRIAVKRPLRAEPLASAPPSFSITGKSSRFDVYLPFYL